MKIIALYLPQFHIIPENEKWWGKGFTEWVNVKKATPLFEGHNQPRIPLNNNYYDLSDIEVMRWQTELAKKYGVYGFCFYHYWFGGKLLLEKPIENFLKSNIEFHYCISWANEHWTNQWVSDKWDVLIEQKYGGKKEWQKHFNYLLPFFNDERYIKYNKKPIFTIYKPELIDKRKEMLEYWNELAVNAGFPGICFIFQRAESILYNPQIDMSMFDFCAAYQPGLAVAKKNLKTQKMVRLRKIKKNFFHFLEKHTKFDSRSIVLTNQWKTLQKDDYDQIWNSILDDEDFFPNIIPCAFTDWDNTPRRHERGSVMIGSSPEKFQNYFEKLILKSRKKYKTDFMYLFAWNEWAEGGYLEPDIINEDSYLKAIKATLDKTNENPFMRKNK